MFGISGVRGINGRLGINGVFGYVLVGVGEIVGVHCGVYMRDRNRFGAMKVLCSCLFEQWLG